MTQYFYGPSAGSTIQTGEIDDNAITLAKMAHGTDGNLITYNASGAPAAVVTGAATQVLTSNGAGAAPTFQAAAGGGGGNLELIETDTSAGGAANFSAISGYKYLLLVFEFIPGTSADITMTFNGDTGNNYEYVRQSSAAAAGVTAAANFQLSEGRTDYATVGTILIGVTTRSDKCSVGCALGTQTTRWRMLCGTWAKGSAGAVTQIDIANSGNLTGYCSLYGVKET